MSRLNSNINALFGLFNHDVSALEYLVKEYPASSLTRLLLLKKYREADHPLYKKAKISSAIYMGHVPWYLFVLSQLEEENTVSVLPDDTAGPPEIVNEETTESMVQQNKPAVVPVQVEFEPLHMIDYFASQGIQLREEDLKDDRLSQQVKSFTGWLKSMKKLHPGKLPEQDAVIEKLIQNAAEVSNVGSDVLTEAMAEVLVKQNKKDKAIDMYQKLSLKNPAKSAYFAAKIESLKTT